MKGIVIDIDIQESFSYSLISPPVFFFKPIDKAMECDLAFFFLFSHLYSVFWSSFSFPCIRFFLFFQAINFGILGMRDFRLSKLECQDAVLIS